MVAAGSGGHSSAEGGGDSMSLRNGHLKSNSSLLYPRSSCSSGGSWGGFGRNVRITVCANQGGRKYMEDRVHIHCQRNATGMLDYIYVAVYDGHGGADASIHAKQHLLESIVEQRGFQLGTDQGMLEAIQEGFLQTHTSMKRVVDKWPRTASGFTSTSGTTASVAFIRNGKLYSGHVGDSGIVLGIKESNAEETVTGKQLTIDHKPDSPDELKRIEDGGGQVMSKAGVMRVVWTRPIRGHVGPVRRSTPQEKIPFLAVARALGDLWSYNDRSEKYIVSPDPDMDVVKLTSKQVCMVLGSDGLWNVIKSQYCVDIVNTHEWKELKEEGRLADNLKFLTRPCHSNHSRWLIRHALRGWGALRADNISAITVIFDPPEARLEENSSCVLQSDPHLDIEKILTETPDAMIRITPYTTQVLKTAPVELVYSGAVDGPLGQPALFSRNNGTTVNLAPVAYSGPGFSSYTKETTVRRQSLNVENRPKLAVNKLKFRNSIGSFSGESESSELESEEDDDEENRAETREKSGAATPKKRTFYCTKHGLTCEKVRRLNEAAEGSGEKLEQLLAKNNVKPKDSPAKSKYTSSGKKPKYFCRKHGLSCTKVKKMNEDYFKQLARNNTDSPENKAQSKRKAAVSKEQKVRASISSSKSQSVPSKRRLAVSARKRRSLPAVTPQVHNTRQYSRTTRAGTHLSPTRSLPSLKLRSTESRKSCRRAQQLNSSLHLTKARASVSKRKLFGREAVDSELGKGIDSCREGAPIPKRAKFWNGLLSSVFGASAKN